MSKAQPSIHTVNRLLVKRCMSIPPQSSSLRSHVWVKRIGRCTLHAQMGNMGGSQLKEPVTSCYVAGADVGGAASAVVQMHGRRKHQEDRHVFLPHWRPGCALFAVLDGHGSYEAAAWLQATLPEHWPESGNDWDGRAKRAALALDRRILTVPLSVPPDPRQPAKSSTQKATTPSIETVSPFVKSNEDEAVSPLVKSNEDGKQDVRLLSGGSTLIVATVDAAGRVRLANVGDSRAIVVRLRYSSATDLAPAIESNDMRNGDETRISMTDDEGRSPTPPLTNMILQASMRQPLSDHTVAEPGEAQRVAADARLRIARGRVELLPGGTYLAMSRAFNDRPFKASPAPAAAPTTGRPLPAPAAALPTTDRPLPDPATAAPTTIHHLPSPAAAATTTDHPRSGSATSPGPRSLGPAAATTTNHPPSGSATSPGPRSLRPAAATTTDHPPSGSATSPGPCSLAPAATTTTNHPPSGSATSPGPRSLAPSAATTTNHPPSGSATSPGPRSLAPAATTTTNHPRSGSATSPGPRSLAPSAAMTTDHPRSGSATSPGPRSLAPAAATTTDHPRSGSATSPGPRSLAPSAAMTTDHPRSGSATSPGPRSLAPAAATTTDHPRSGSATSPGPRSLAPSAAMTTDHPRSGSATSPGPRSLAPAAATTTDHPRSGSATSLVPRSLAPAAAMTTDHPRSGSATSLVPRSLAPASATDGPLRAAAPVTSDDPSRALVVLPDPPLRSAAASTDHLYREFLADRSWPEPAVAAHPLADRSWPEPAVAAHPLWTQFLADHPWRAPAAPFDLQGLAVADDRASWTAAMSEVTDNSHSALVATAGRPLPSPAASTDHSLHGRAAAGAATHNSCRGAAICDPLCGAAAAIDNCGRVRAAVTTGNPGHVSAAALSDADAGVSRNGGVIALPDTCEFGLGDDELLLLFSDGVTEALTNDAVAGRICGAADALWDRRPLERRTVSHLDSHDLAAFADDIVKAAVAGGSRDNITIIVCRRPIMLSGRSHSAVASTVGPSRLQMKSNSAATATREGETKNRFEQPVGIWRRFEPGPVVTDHKEFVDAYAADIRLHGFEAQMEELMTAGRRLAPSAPSAYDLAPPPAAAATSGSRLYPPYLARPAPPPSLVGVLGLDDGDDGSAIRPPSPVPDSF